MTSSSCGVAGHPERTREPLVRMPRLYRLIATMTLFSLILGGLLLAQPSHASAAQSGAVTTDYLNLRSGPSTSSSILTVMPVGMAVTITGSAQSGFYPLNYGGMSGFASGDYLSVGGGSSDIETGGATGNATVINGALNLRSGPGTGHSVLTVMPDRASVTLTGESANGFLGVTYNGVSGFAFAEYLSTSGSSAPSQPADPPVADNPGGPVGVGDSVVDSAVTTSSLNLRQGPGTSYGVQVVMPAGAKVDVMGTSQNGFYPLSYNGTKGWASGDYLTIGATSAPPSSPAPSNPGGGDIVSIIYAAADAYGQPREDMLRVAQCESLLDPTLVNPASDASGLFQFLPSTWATTPYANQNIFDPVANANAAAWMWSVGRRGEWVCQ